MFLLYFLFEYPRTNRCLVFTFLWINIGTQARSQSEHRIETVTSLGEALDGKRNSTASLQVCRERIGKGSFIWNCWCGTGKDQGWVESGDTTKFYCRLSSPQVQKGLENRLVHPGHFPHLFPAHRLRLLEWGYRTVWISPHCMGERTDEQPCQSYTLFPSHNNTAIFGVNSALK